MCGGSFDTSDSDLAVQLIPGKIKCPHCGQLLKLAVSRKKSLHERWYYTIVTTFKGWQVCRNFSVEKYLAQGDNAAYYEVNEVVQNWIDADGNEEVIARPIRPTAGCYDNWNFSKPMELRDARYRDPYKPDKYRVGGAWVYPRRRIIPIAVRNGYTALNETGIPESEHIRLLITDREAEMLEKCGQYSLFAYKQVRGIPEFGLQYPHAIRVANRARYIVKDAGLWFDYLELLNNFHLDTHNAHYVCPADLKVEHDRLMRRHRRIEAEREETKRIADIAAKEKNYKTTKGKYFGICFGNDDITITVISSVAEMAEEGKTMHHCVYAAGYYSRKHSLILSAKDKAGNRLETIELDLKSYKVVQSRAVCNGISDRHADILKLVNDNIHLFKLPA